TEQPGAAQPEVVQGLRPGLDGGGDGDRGYIDRGDQRDKGHQPGPELPHGPPGHRAHVLSHTFAALGTHQSLHGRRPDASQASPIACGIAMPRIVTERMCPMSSPHYSLIPRTRDAYEILRPRLPNATKVRHPRPRSSATNSV